MRILKPAGLAFMILAAGCTAELRNPVGPDNPADPLQGPGAAGTVTSVRQARDSVFLIGGMSQTIAVYVLDSQLRGVSDRIVSWASSDETIVTIQPWGNCAPVAVAGCYRTSVSGLATGTATVTATVDGISSTARVRVVVNPSRGDGDIDVEFEVIEFLPNLYAPLVTVTEAHGRAGVEVIALSIMIPGRINSVDCQATVALRPGGTTSMFDEIYGDYQLVINGPRNSDEARVAVYTRDASARVSVTEVSGAIVPGGWPVTYTGGTPRNAWECR